MTTIEEIQINQLLRELFDDNQDIRIRAISQLGEFGDDLCLEELKEQLYFIDLERDALLTAIAKLKKKLLKK